MSFARRLRTGLVAVALIALGSLVSVGAVAQANDNDRAPMPSASQPGSEPDTSRPSTDSQPPYGSDEATGSTGQSTGQDHADPGSSPSGGRGGASNAPNCATMPPNAAECPQPSQGR